MHRVALAVGLALLVACAGTAVISYREARADCSRDLFTGNFTNPGGCRTSSEALGLSVLVIAVSAVLVVLAFVLRRKDRPEAFPAPPTGTAPKAPAAEGHDPRAPPPSGGPRREP